MDGFITGQQWSDRYAAESTPWDLGVAHPELMQRLATMRGPGKALVPGCGKGHDARALAQAGWTVTALDYAEGLRPVLEPLMDILGGEAVIGDAFAFDGGPFDLVFDHTFFCAIDPAQRPAFGAFMDLSLIHI